jgi:hypothetical protein
LSQIPSHGSHQQITAKEREVIAALVGLFLAAGRIGPGIVPSMRRILATLVPAPPEEALTFVLGLSGGDIAPESPMGPPGPVEALERQAAVGWIALYLVRATERLTAATAAGDDALNRAESDEVLYSQLRSEAESRRLAAAHNVDVLAERYADHGQPGLLGWRATIYERTTPECRWASGKNFRADRMPVIGLPGAVHLRCRCRAVPPFPGAPLIPSA